MVEIDKTSATSILQSVANILTDNNYELAAHILAESLDFLLDHAKLEELEAFLDHLPNELIYKTPDLGYCKALLLAKCGRLSDAINLLERTRYAYQFTVHDDNKVVQCWLELARLYLARERFHTALHYLTEEVQPLIEDGRVDDPYLLARYYLRMAELYPDIGQFRKGLECAKRAWSLFRQIGNHSGEFQAAVRIARSLLQLGEYAEAASKLEIAVSCCESGNLGNNAKVRLLNLQSHLHWHKGELAEAEQIVQHYLALVEREEFSNFRVYALMLLGNLHREMGNYPQAEQLYADARAIMEAISYQSYQPWIDAQLAWLNLLRGRFAPARSLIQASLATSDLGQAMSFQVILAVLELIEGQYALSERLFFESQSFYERSGDELALCAIQNYRALVASKQNHPQLAFDLLQSSFGWLAERRIDFIPYWWHAPLMAEICLLALKMNVSPELAERILLNRLRESGLEALRNALQYEDADLRNRAALILHSTGQALHSTLDNFKDDVNKRMLEELISAGKLRSEGLIRLQRELMTANHRQTPNLTLLAVFGLYVDGQDREEIAKQLNCTTTTVRNYITIIYQHFAIHASEFNTRKGRLERLIAVAREQGYL